MVFCSELIIEHDTKCVMLRTWLMPRHGEGKVTVLFRAPRPVNTISFDFKQFSFKLFVSAQSCTCLSSLALVSELTAGTIMYVSSANLTSALPTCIGWRSDAVTTKDAGPIAEPWITLAKMSVSSEVSRSNPVQCEWPLKKSLIQLYTASGRARRAIFSMRTAYRKLC